MDIEEIKSILDALVKDPSLQPKNGKTFCNIAVSRIATIFGVEDFPVDCSNDPPLADVMCDILAVSPNFHAVSTQGANFSSLQGNLVIAAHPYVGHGHVAIVYPSPEMFFSPSWKKEVPFVANVGARNGIFPVSEVFPVAQGEPKYYVYQENT